LQSKLKLSTTMLLLERRAVIFEMRANYASIIQEESLGRSSTTFSSQLTACLRDQHVLHFKTYSITRKHRLRVFVPIDVPASYWHAFERRNCGLARHFKTDHTSSWWQLSSRADEQAMCVNWVDEEGINRPARQVIGFVLFCFCVLLFSKFAASRLCLGQIFWPTKLEDAKPALAT
jgi:hypothetical protein